MGHKVYLNKGGIGSRRLGDVILEESYLEMKITKGIQATERTQQNRPHPHPYLPALPA
jgi:hypothetical protein